MQNECEWHLDEEEANAWESECGLVWCLDEGTPKENEMAFCPKCGRHLTQRVADGAVCDLDHDMLALEGHSTCPNCGAIPPRR